MSRWVVVSAFGVMAAFLHTAVVPAGGEPCGTPLGEPPATTPKGGPVAKTGADGELGAAWEDLAGTDAVKAYRGIWALVQSPRQAVPFLQGRLKAVLAVDSAAIDQFIEDLDSNKFAVREQARRALERLAELAGPALRKAHARGLTVEAQRRVEQLLARVKQP